MTQFSLAALITSVTTFLLGVFVFIYNRKSTVNKIFCLYSLSISEWSFFTALHALTASPALSLLSAKIMHIGVPFIPVLFFNFCLVMLDSYNKYKKTLVVGYFMAAIFIIVNFMTPLVILRVRPKLGYSYFMDGGALYPFLIAMFSVYAIMGLYLLLRAYLVSSGSKRNQLKYLFWGSLLGYTLGALNFLPVYNITKLPYHLGSYGIALYVAIAAYAIVRYRLMDIEIIVKKTAIFAGLFLFVSMSFVGTAFLMQEFLGDVFGANTKWVRLMFSITIITLGIRPLEKMLIKLTDRFLFQKKYDYQQTLKEASEGMTLVTNMKKLLNLIIRVVTKNIRIRNAVIFQLDEAKNKYVLRIRRGTNRKHTGYSLGQDSALVWWLKHHKEAILCDEIEDWLRSERFLRKEQQLKEKLIEIKEELCSVDGSICVPSFGKGKLIGFLILGEKLSGDIYTQEDIRLLSTLASEAAIAVENAKNFMELEKMREKERESYLQTVLALAQTVDEKDSYTHGHLEAVTHYGMRVAEELEESPEFKIDISKDDLQTALALHDIGKIGVPDAILNKNGNLNAEEWTIMKQHCEIGARIVEPIEKLKNVGKIIRHHQEKYDGTGYPDGLKGEEIPLESRIIGVVDAYHAMVSDRPYRKALLEQPALKELKNNMGTQFDPFVVGAFIKAWEKGKIKRDMS